MPRYLMLALLAGACTGCSEAMTESAPQGQDRLMVRSGHPVFSSHPAVAVAAASGTGLASRDPMKIFRKPQSG